MAIHRSPLFEGARGSIRHQLVFRQIGGKTVVSKFPDRSKVIYSEAQRAAQRRFADAVSFARVVIKNPDLKRIYALKAIVLRYRSAWNVAIAEFMDKLPLRVKRRKTFIQLPSGNNFPGIRLYTLDKAQELIHISPVQSIPLQRDKPRVVLREAQRGGKRALGWETSCLKV